MKQLEENGFQNNSSLSQSLEKVTFPSNFFMTLGLPKRLVHMPFFIPNKGTKKMPTSASFVFHDTGPGHEYHQLQETRISQSKRT